MFDQFHGNSDTPHTRIARRCHDAPDATDTLYRLHHPMVYRYCLGMMRTAESADDAAQSTWMHAMVALAAPGTVVRNTRAWLCAIARNQCLDMLRARQAAKTQDISALEIAAHATTDGDYEIREQLQSLLCDLQTLSERQRSAIVLREICGLSSSELAGEFDTTPQRASGLVADARRTLTQRRRGRLLACEDVRHQLEHSSRRTVAVRAHLESCASCDSVEPHTNTRRA